MKAMGLRNKSNGAGKPEFETTDKKSLRTAGKPEFWVGNAEAASGIAIVLAALMLAMASPVYSSASPSEQSMTTFLLHLKSHASFKEFVINELMSEVDPKLNLTHLNLSGFGDASTVLDIPKTIREDCVNAYPFYRNVTCDAVAIYIFPLLEVKAKAWITVYSAKVKGITDTLKGVEGPLKAEQLALYSMVLLFLGLITAFGSYLALSMSPARWSEVHAITFMTLAAPLNIIGFLTISLGIGLYFASNLLKAMQNDALYLHQRMSENLAALLIMAGINLAIAAYTIFVWIYAGHRHAYGSMPAWIQRLAPALFDHWPNDSSASGQGKEVAEAMMFKVRLGERLTYASSEEYATSMGGRLLTLREARAAMNKWVLCPGEDQWCAVQGRDWVQVGNRYHCPGKSFVKFYHHYPAWGDDVNFRGNYHHNPHVVLWADVAAPSDLAASPEMADCCTDDPQGSTCTIATQRIADDPNNNHNRDMGCWDDPCAVDVLEDPAHAASIARGNKPEHDSVIEYS